MTIAPALLASFAAAFVFMYRKREHFDFDFKLSSFKVYKKPLLVLLRLGIPRALQSSLINVSLLFCSSRINAFGIIASAVKLVKQQIQLPSGPETNQKLWHTLGQLYELMLQNTPVITPAKLADSYCALMV